MRVSKTAALAGLDVKKADVHGMSQRGGSVTSDVRFGPRVLSPMVPPGEANFLVVLAEDQVAIHRRLLDPDGVLVVKSSDQDITHHRTLLSKLLGRPINKIRVIMTPVGGGFGGKEDMIYQAILAIAALKTRRPVKLVFSRQDSLIGSAKRHPVRIHHKIGLSRDGRIRALEITLDADGEFVQARAVDEKIVIPATEKSAGRSGTKPAAGPDKPRYSCIRFVVAPLLKPAGGTAPRRSATRRCTA